jgi:Uma2 family endonuclease
VIRGFLYVTSIFTAGHQFVVGQLGFSFHDFISPQDLGMVLLAPCDVMLPDGIATPVEPDVMFFRKGNQPTRESIYFAGVPDLLSEILSSETYDRDRTIKLKAYEDAGVPEYWLVDPESRTVEVHVLESGKYVERSRGGVGDAIGSAALPGFRVNVAGLFMP